MLTKVKFTTFGANSAFGAFAPGDVMRTSAELAKHLVDEIGVAKYDPEPAVEEASTPVPAPTKPATTDKSSRKGK